MYESILVTLDTTPTDRAIIEHIKQLATLMHSTVTLLHVATSVPAQMFGADAAGQEIREDTAYLAGAQREFESAGIPVRTHLAYGDPVKEIVKWVKENDCQLVAMSTHGHHLVADLVLGTTANRVQHAISVPVLLLRAK
jgi:nucleotide-binding universal stress UspA family protein